MADDFSLIGYENVPIAEYVPILQKIRDDLKIISELGMMRKRNLRFDILNNSIMQSQSIDKGTQVMDSTISTPAKTLQEETVIEGQSNNHNYQHASICETVNYEVHRPDNEYQNNYGNDNADESCTIETRLKSELQILKEQLLSKSDENDQMKDELTRSNGQIDSLKAKYKKIKEILNDKDNKIKSLNDTNKNLTDEFNEKCESLQNLREEMNRIQMEKSTPKTNENKKENPELQRIIEEYIKKISDLESTISKLEAKNIENNDYKDKVADLENKIISLETRNDEIVDLNYQKLMNNLTKKREEIREKDHKNNELESDLDDLKMKHRKLEKLYANLCSKYDSIKQDLDECEKQKDQLEETSRGQARELKKLRKSSISDDEVAKYKSELKEYKEQLKQKDAEFKRNEYETIGLKEKCDKLSKDNEKSMVKFQELEKYKSDMKAKNKDLDEKTKKIEELQNECTKKQQAMAVMREKIKGKPEEKADPQEMKKLNFKLKGVEMELDQAHNKIENLNAAYETKAREYDLSMKQIQNLNGEIANLKKLFNSNNHDGMAREHVAPQERPNANEFPDWWKTHMGAK